MTEPENLQAENDAELSDTRVKIGGNEYCLKFTDWHARELQPIGFELYDWQTHPQTLGVMFEASPLLSKVLMVLCEPDNETDFLKGLDSETCEQARIAVRGAVRNFFPPDTRSGISKVYDYLRVDIRKQIESQVEEKLNHSLSAP